MSMNVHDSLEREYVEKGYVVVGRPQAQRVELAHKDRTCLRLLRSGHCRMDKGHRGRCSTVVFYCDNCGKARRGFPAGRAKDPNGDEVAVFCFMCVVVNN